MPLDGRLTRDEIIAQLTLKFTGFTIDPGSNIVPGRMFFVDLTENINPENKISIMVDGRGEDIKIIGSPRTQIATED